MRGGSIYRPGVRTLHPPTRGHCTPALAGHCGHRGLLMTLSRYVTLHMSRYVTLHVTPGAGVTMLQCRRPLADWSLPAPSSPGPPVCLYCTLYTVHTTVLYTVHSPPRTWPWSPLAVARLLATQARLPGARGGEDGSTSDQVQVRCSRCVPAPLCTAAWQHRVGHHRPGVAGGWAGLGWLGWAGLGWLGWAGLCKKL